MQINTEDDFQVIQSQYELIESQRVDESALRSNSPKYEITITPTKNELDLNIMENQYYQLEVSKQGQHIYRVERRFSQFQLIYDILVKKQGGFIFPAFPENGLFAFMKSKVSISKDEFFIRRRLKIITRFFNIILNNPLFDPQSCSQTRVFLSQSKQFQARKQIQKSNQGIFNFGWNKIKTYFTLSKDNKYVQEEQKIKTLKTSLQNIYTKSRLLLQLLKEEQQENIKFLSTPSPISNLEQYSKLLKQHTLQQSQNILDLETLEFNLFCENEDLLMIHKIFDRINELKDNQDNYPQLKAIENQLDRNLQAFLKEKSERKNRFTLELKWAIDAVKQKGRLKQ